MSIKSKTTQRTLKSLEKITGSPLTLGRCIWAIRQCEELSQVEFAKKLNISRQHLCDLEHDRKMVRPKLAASYANLLEESEEQFIRLALQGLLEREGLKYEVEVHKSTSKRKRAKLDKLATNY